MSISENYPKILAKIDESEFVDSVRDLVVVDENYDDVDSDEFDVFDPSEYNFMIYITERLQNVLGEEGLQHLIEKLEVYEDFENFYKHESDILGIMIKKGTEESISKVILDMIEEELV